MYLASCFHCNLPWVQTPILLCAVVLIQVIFHGQLALGALLQVSVVTINLTRSFTFRWQVWESFVPQISLRLDALMIWFCVRNLMSTVLRYANWITVRCWKGKAWSLSWYFWRPEPNVFPLPLIPNECHWNKNALNTEFLLPSSSSESSDVDSSN